MFTLLVAVSDSGEFDAETDSGPVDDDTDTTVAPVNVAVVTAFMYEAPLDADSTMPVTPVTNTLPVDDEIDDEAPLNVTLLALTAKLFDEPVAEVESVTPVAPLR